MGRGYRKGQMTRYKFPALGDSQAQEFAGGIISRMRAREGDCAPWRITPLPMKGSKGGKKNWGVQVHSRRGEKYFVYSSRWKEGECMASKSWDIIPGTEAEGDVPLDTSRYLYGVPARRTWLYLNQFTLSNGSELGITAKEVLYEGGKVELCFGDAYRVNYGNPPLSGGLNRPLIEAVESAGLQYEIRGASGVGSNPDSGAQVFAWVSPTDKDMIELFKLNRDFYR